MIYLALIGAGEYTSLEDGNHTQFLRFRAQNGEEMNVDTTAEQVAVLMAFAVGNTANSVPVDPVYPGGVPGDTPYPQNQSPGTDGGFPATYRKEPRLFEDDIDPDDSL